MRESGHVLGGRDMGRCIYAVFAVSLLLHLVAFWPDAVKQAEYPVTPLLVRLVSAPSEVVPVRESVEEPPADKRAVASNSVRGSGERRTLGLQSQQAMVRIAPARTGDVSIGELSMSPSEANARKASPFSSADDESGDARLIGRYRLALAAAAIRLQLGSEEVLVAAGLKGQSVVIVNVIPGVARPDVRIVESSGLRVLDESALALVQRAVLDVPAPLRGRQFSVVLPVLFETM